MTTRKDLIVDSLDRAAQRCTDITQPVYDRLFMLLPETRARFRADPGNFIKTSMLELAIDAIVDFAGERKAAHRLIVCEVQSHDGYGTTPELFSVFFVAIADVLRDVLKEDWSPEHQAAWDSLISEINDYIASGVQAMA